MITRTDLLDKLQNGAVWNTGVTFERTNPIPIEKYSIFATVDAAKDYINNPESVAYPGQIIAVVPEEGDTFVIVVKAMYNSCESVEEYSLTIPEFSVLGIDFVNLINLYLST